MSWGTSKRELESFNDINDIRNRLRDLEFLLSGIQESRVTDTLTNSSLLTSGSPASPSSINSYFYGTFKEPFDATVSEAGGVITLTLDDAAVGGAGLTMRFSDGETTLGTPATLVITGDVGTDASPQLLWVYILQSGKVLASSTSSWPAETVEHIKVCILNLPSAAFIGTDGPYVNQNINDPNTNATSQGHLSHLARKIRLLQATWFSGVAGNGTSNYLTPAAGNVEFKSTSGIIFQMHSHTFPAFDTSGGDTVLVKNWSGDAYHNITDLYDITADSGGNAIGNNKFFNLICWGAANKTGEAQFLLINLPAGFYNTQAGAESDIDGHDDFSIPRDFNVDSSVGFLICRITIQMKTGGGTWVVASTVDLRGRTPQTASGGSGTSRYTDAEAVNAVEAVANAAVATGDSMTFVDVTDGVLKQDLISDLLALHPRTIIRGAALTDKTAFGAVSTWEQWTSTLDFGSQSGTVHVSAQTIGSIFGGVNDARAGKVRVAISLDNGGAWTSGEENWVEFDDVNASVRRVPCGGAHYRTGTATSNVLVKVEVLIDGGATSDMDFITGTLTAQLGFV